MAIFESLFGFLTGSAAAAAGAGINARNRKKRWDAYQAQENAKLQSKVDFGNQVRAAEDAETAAFRRKLESWIGGPLEEDQKKKRYYNLPREYELALQYLNEMFERYKKSHPPGSPARCVDVKFSADYSRSAGQVLWDFVAVPREEMLPYSELVYSDYVEKAFWQQSMDRYRGPHRVGDQVKAVTYHVSPGTYALGLARQQIIREGFLPSNCRDQLWINWSPYVRWTGDEWNRQFHTAVDIGHHFELSWIAPHLIPRPQTDHVKRLIGDMQRGYERQHPEHFKVEALHE